MTEKLRTIIVEDEELARNLMKSFLAKIDETMIVRAGRLKWVQALTAGVDGMPLETIAARVASASWCVRLRMRPFSGSPITNSFPTKKLKA